MAYEVEFSDEAAMQLEGIDKNTAKRILKKLESVRENPGAFLEGLTARPQRKLRVGDYRLLIIVDKSKRKIFIMSLGHRKNIYERH